MTENIAYDSALSLSLSLHHFLILSHYVMPAQQRERHCVHRFEYMQINNAQTPKGEIINQVIFLILLLIHFFPLFSCVIQHWLWCVCVCICERCSLSFLQSVRFPLLLYAFGHYTTISLWAWASSIIPKLLILHINRDIHCIISVQYLFYIIPNYILFVCQYSISWKLNVHAWQRFCNIGAEGVVLPHRTTPHMQQYYYTETQLSDQISPLKIHFCKNIYFLLASYSFIGARSPHGNSFKLQ